MRIALLCTSTTLHRHGGTEVHAETLARLAANRGHSVFLVTTAHPEGIATEIKDGYTVIYLEATSYRMSRRDAPAWWKASAERTAKLCKDERIDVVWAENFAGLAYAAIPRRERRPVVSIVNGLAVRGEIASNFSGVSSAGELLYFLTRYAAQTLFYYIPWFKAMVRDSDLLVGVSRETREALAREFPGSEKKTRVIFNSVNTTLFRPDAALRVKTRGELGLSNDSPVLLMSGVIHKQKGMHVGVDAFKKLSREFPEARLLIAGDGPQSAELKAQADGAGLRGKVIFCGPRPNSEMPFYYNAADIYLNPTLRHEGLAIVIVEAMACGLPSVISRIGGTGSTLDDGISGFFVKPRDAEGLAERAAALLRDRPMAAAMGRAAREKAVRDFSENNIDQYLKVSDELAGDGA
jgi:glycosyltransferase involved in cell wall biosynthesis